jgi:hypothetical protein
MRQCHIYVVSYVAYVLSFFGAYEAGMSTFLVFKEDISDYMLSMCAITLFHHFVSIIFTMFNMFNNIRLRFILLTHLARTMLFSIFLTVLHYEYDLKDKYYYDFWMSYVVISSFYTTGWFISHLLWLHANRVAQCVRLTSVITEK